MRYKIKRNTSISVINSNFVLHTNNYIYVMVTMLVRAYITTYIKDNYTWLYVIFDTNLAQTHFLMSFLYAYKNGYSVYLN